MASSQWEIWFILDTHQALMLLLVIFHAFYFPTIKFITSLILPCLPPHPNTQTTSVSSALYRAELFIPSGHLDYRSDFLTSLLVPESWLWARHPLLCCHSNVLKWKSDCFHPWPKIPGCLPLPTVQIVKFLLVAKRPLLISVSSQAMPAPTPTTCSNLNTWS